MFSGRIAGRTSRRSLARRALRTKNTTGRAPAVAVATRNGANIFLRQCFYTTERVVELRTGKQKEEQPKTLYDGSNEAENCGVGLIASLKSEPSRSIITQADEMLVRMSHRGGCGCDPASGDGSGKFLMERTQADMLLLQ